MNTLRTPTKSRSRDEGKAEDNGDDGGGGREEQEIE